MPLSIDRTQGTVLPDAEQQLEVPRSPAIMQDYVLDEVIGSGSFGDVYRASRRNAKDDVVVIKRMRLQGLSTRQKEACEQEAKLLSGLAHPGIVTYFDAFKDEATQDLCLVMEYCDGGDLADLISASDHGLDQRPGLAESVVLDYFAQMALAMQYMHAQNLVHRDLKSKNMFLCEAHKRRVKLGDFGVSKELQSSTDFAETCIGTPYYMSPELFHNRPYNAKSDIWALGCIVYEMLTGSHAFKTSSLSDLASRVVAGKFTEPVGRSPCLVHLLKRMLNVDPDKRPSATQILKGPLLKRPLRFVVERYLGATMRAVERRNLERQLGSIGLSSLALPSLAASIESRLVPPLISANARAKLRALKLSQRQRKETTSNMRQRVANEKVFHPKPNIVKADSIRPGENVDHLRNTDGELETSPPTHRGCLILELEEDDTVDLDKTTLVINCAKSPVRSEATPNGEPPPEPEAEARQAAFANPATPPGEVEDDAGRDTRDRSAFKKVNGGFLFGTVQQRLQILFERGISEFGKAKFDEGHNIVTKSRLWMERREQVKRDLARLFGTQRFERAYDLLEQIVFAESHDL